MVINYTVSHLWNFLLQGPAGAHSLCKFKNQADEFTWLRKDLKSQTADRGISEERPCVLALFLSSPQVCITGLRWKQTTSSRDLSSLLVQPHVAGSPSGRASGKMHRAGHNQDETCISPLTFQINSNGMRQQIF